jgi:hypothetical protein
MLEIIVIVLKSENGEEMMRAEEIVDGARRRLYHGHEAAIGRTTAWSLLC